MTLKSVLFYQSPENLPGAFDTLFGGLFLVKGIPLIAQLGFLLCFAASAAAAYQSLEKARPWRRVSFFFSTVAFFLLCLFLLQPWDEVFINLRHALNWANGDGFSFNARAAQEGTVETIPYLFVGVLIRLGLRPLDAGFVMSALGGAGILFGSARLLTHWGITRNLPFYFLALCVFPPLAYNSSHGFGTTWFTAAVVAGLNLLFYSRLPALGLGVLALLPLVRFEGWLLSVLLLGVWAHTKKLRAIPAFSIALVVSLPAIAHALYRAFHYGYAVPMPVQYKASAGSLFFLAVGLRNFAADAIASHALAMALALGVLWKLKRPTEIQWKVLAALLLFSGAYYTSGGDWFPSYWARYLFPFTIGMLLVLFASLNATKTWKAGLVLPAVFFVVASLWPISSTWKAVDHLFRTAVRLR